MKTDREKLIELICEGASDICGKDCKMPRNQFFTYCLSISNYLLANGVIVLPCKVGDTVYKIENGKVVERQILDFTYNGRLYVRLRPFTSYEYAIGEDVFLNKAEADIGLIRINEIANILEEDQND